LPTTNANIIITAKNPAMCHLDKERFDNMMQLLRNIDWSKMEQIERRHAVMTAASLAARPT
jgi:hypothetical protein